jgi:hypothetical protein
MQKKPSGVFRFEQDGRSIEAHFSFYRGENTNYFPSDETFDRNSGIIPEYIVKGWMPDQPFIDTNTLIVPFGSCFAANITKYLQERNYNVPTKVGNRAYVTRMGDGIVHTHAIRQQFEWAWLNKVPQSELWHGYKAQEFGYDEKIRLVTKELFDRTEVFIITLGLSEIWYDEPTGEVFWRAVPSHRYDPERHKFRVSSVDENKANLSAILQLIRIYRPAAKLILTLSPVALTATFRPVSCVTANAASKAILRAALDEFLRTANDGNVFYFPSYEIVTQCFDIPFLPDRKHPHAHVLQFNMATFERYFCRSGMSDDDLLNLFRSAQLEDARLAHMNRSERLAATGFSGAP